MQTEEEQSDISTTSIIRADSKSGKLYVSQKLQSKTLDGIHKLLRLKKNTIQIHYIKTVATMNIV